MPFVNHRDMDDAWNIAIDILENSRNFIIEEVGKELDREDFNGNETRVFREMFESVFEYLAVLYDQKRVDVFKNDRTLDEAVANAVSVTAQAYMWDNTDLMDDLKLDRAEERDCEKHYEKYQKMLDELDRFEKDMERRERDRDYDRDRDRDRDRNRRRDRSRDRDRKGGASTTYRTRDDREDRNRGRDRDRDRDRDDRKSDKASRYGRRDVKREREEREREERDDVVDHNDDVLTDIVKLEVPRVETLKKSKVKTVAIKGEPTSVAFNPSQFGAYALASKDVVVNTLIEHTGETDMETYKEHELNKSLVAEDRGGRKVIPVADFRTIRALSDDEVDASTKARIICSDAINVVSDNWRIPTHSLLPTIKKNADYEIIRMNVYRPIAIPTGIFEQLNAEIRPLYEARRFDDYFEWITRAQQCMLSLQREDEFAMGHFLNFIGEHLTFLVNNLFAIVSDMDLTMTNFFHDWMDAKTFLMDNKNVDMYNAWNELEVEYLRHNFSLVDDATVAKLIEAGTIVSGDIEGERPAKGLWFHSKEYAVLVRGDMLGSVQVTDAARPAKVDFKFAPEFYEACLRIARYRNKTMTMSNVMMVDSVGTQIMLLANKTEVPNIKVRLI